MWIFDVRSDVLGWSILVGLFLLFVYSVFGRFFFLFCQRSGKEAEVHGYTSKRVLGPYETGLALINQNLGSIRTTTVHLLSADLSVSCIREGLRVMQARYPILRMGTHFSGLSELSFHEYEDASRRIQMDVVGRKGDEHWREEIQHQAYLGSPEPVTPNQLLWRTVLLFNTSEDIDSSSGSGKNKRHELFLMASHCALDGTSAVMFGALLMHYCERLQYKMKDIKAENREVALQIAADELCREVWVSDLLPSIEDLSAKHPQFRPSLTWPQALLPVVPRSIVGFLTHTHAVQPFTFVSMHKRRDHVKCCVLERDDLTRLRELCREHSVTVQSALMGAGVKAYQETFKSPEGAKVEGGCPIRLGNVMNIDRKELGVYVSHCFEVTTLRSPSTDLWSYAAASHTHLHVNPMTRVPVLAFQAMIDWPGLKLAAGCPPLIRLMLGALSMLDGGRGIGNFMVSNLGDLTQFLPEQIDAWREAYLTQDGRALGAEFFIFTYSFRGQLHITTTWTEPLMAREKGELFVQNFVHFLKNPTSIRGVNA